MCRYKHKERRGLEKTVKDQNLNIEVLDEKGNKIGVCTGISFGKNGDEFANIKLFKEIKFISVDVKVKLK